MNSMRGMCGNCGCKTFKVQLFGDNSESFESIELECTKCNSVSVLSVPKPEIVVDWGKDAKGILCPG